MEINPHWSFKEVINKVRAMKTEYLGVLSLFSCYDCKEKTRYIHETRDKIYSLQMNDWQKDKIWEYMNDDIDFTLLIVLRNRQRG